MILIFQTDEANRRLRRRSGTKAVFRKSQSLRSKCDKCCLKMPFFKKEKKEEAICSPCSEVLSSLHSKASGKDHHAGEIHIVEF